VPTYRAATAKEEAPRRRDIGKLVAADDRAAGKLAGQHDAIFRTERLVAGDRPFETGEERATIGLVARLRIDQQAVAFGRIELVVAGVAHIFDRDGGRQVLVLAEGVFDIAPHEFATGTHRIPVGQFDTDAR